MTGKKLTVLYYTVCAAAQIVFITGFLRCTQRYSVIAAAAYSLICLVLFRKFSLFFFFLSTAAAAAGILLKAPSFLMIIYSGLSLACMDLAESTRLAAAHSDTGEIRPYLSARLKSLAAVTAAGTALVLAANALRVRIPFWLMLFLATAAFFITGKLAAVLSERRDGS